MSAQRPKTRTEDSSRKSRKRRELAFFLPLCGTFAFASPILDMFTGPETSLGGKVAYIFGCWIVLIVVGFFLSYMLRAEIRDK